MSTSPAIIKFPYRYKRLKFGLIPNPVISIPVLAKAGWEEISFLVDSGADTTSLPLDWAKYLQCEMNIKRKTKISGIENAGTFGFPGKMRIKLGHTELNVRCYFMDSNVIPLLGRLDIWGKFSIVFDNMKEEVVFKSISK